MRLTPKQSILSVFAAVLTTDLEVARLVPELSYGIPGAPAR